MLFITGCSRNAETPVLTIPPEDDETVFLQKRAQAEVYFDRAVTAAANSRDSRQALDDLNQAIETDPTYGPPYLERGYIFMKKGNLNRAIKDFTKAIECDPANPDAYNNRAICYYLKREFEKSWPDVRKVKELGGTPYPVFETSLKKTSGITE